MTQHKPIKPKNPWQLLAIGGFFLLGAILCLFQRGTVLVEHVTLGRGRSWQEVMTPQRAHVYGIIYLLVTMVCIGLYFKIEVEFNGWRLPKFRLRTKRGLNKSRTRDNVPTVQDP